MSVNLTIHEDDRRHLAKVLDREATILHNLALELIHGSPQERKDSVAAEKMAVRLASYAHDLAVDVPGMTFNEAMDQLRPKE